MQNNYSNLKVFSGCKGSYIQSLIKIFLNLFDSDNDARIFNMLFLLAFQTNQFYKRMGKHNDNKISK